MASLLAVAAGVLLGGVGLALLARGVGPLWTGVRLRTRSAPVADAGDGETVTVEGTGRASDGTLDAPLSDADALAYQYEAATGGDDGWDPVVSGHDATPFVLADETGRVVVEPADVDLTAERDFYHGSDALPAGYGTTFEARLADEGHAAAADGGRFVTSKWIRVAHEAIEPGDTVVVTGEVRDDGTGPRIADARLRSPVDDAAVGRLLRRGGIATAVGLACLGLALVVAL